MTLAYLNPRTASKLSLDHQIYAHLILPTQNMHRGFFYVLYASPTHLTVVNSITFVAVVIRYFFCSDTTKTI